MLEGVRKRREPVTAEDVKTDSLSAAKSSESLMLNEKDKTKARDHSLSDKDTSEKRKSRVQRAKDHSEHATEKGNGRIISQSSKDLQRNTVLAVDPLLKTIFLTETKNLTVLATEIILVPSVEMKRVD